MVGFNRRPTFMSKQRHIDTYEQLPPDLKRIVDTQEPWLRVNEAIKLRKRSRARIYEGLKEGRYFAVKDGSTTLINTLSLVLDMANLPPANAKKKPPIAAAPIEPTPPIAAAPPIAATPPLVSDVDAAL
jgi:hypothetical protein